MFKKVTEFFGGLSLPTKDISGEKIYEHLINIGIDAEVIPEGSPDDPDLPPFIVPLSELEFCNFPSPCELVLAMDRMFEWSPVLAAYIARRYAA